MLSNASFVDTCRLTLYLMLHAQDLKRQQLVSLATMRVVVQHQLLRVLHKRRQTMVSSCGSPMTFQRCQPTWPHNAALPNDSAAIINDVHAVWKCTPQQVLNWSHGQPDNKVMEGLAASGSLKVSPLALYQLGAPDGVIFEGKDMTVATWWAACVEASIDTCECKLLQYMPTHCLQQSTTLTVSVHVLSHHAKH